MSDESEEEKNFIKINRKAIDHCKGQKDYFNRQSTIRQEKMEYWRDKASTKR